ncbi:MAG: hydroxysqualene dehydroxylase HpnE [Actinomycetota bacterium]|nr:hydroxysqualene dehydroxylase HpnE [Actinomycetota bacterium]
MTRPHVVVVGGGLAGLSAALHCADGGARVTVVERRRRLGGLTWSFDHDGRSVDNGQHVFLRCCHAYLGFLERIGSADDVTLQDRLDITVIRPATAPQSRSAHRDSGTGRRCQARITRNNLPAPAHLAASLLAYRLLPLVDRARLARAVLPLRHLDLHDPTLDDQTFGAWLAAHGQSARAITALWDLITVATVNLPAAEASLAMGAKVFQTGLLTDAGSADIGWSKIPLGVLHGQRAAAALHRAGAEVAYGELVVRIEPAGPAPTHRPGGGFAVRTDARTLDADAVVVALPHHAVGAVLPAGTVAYQDRLGELGTSPIVDVHLTYDRTVTDLPLMAGVGTPLQWLFDRTASSGLEPGSAQYLAVSLSAAEAAMGRHPDDLVAEAARELPLVLPAAAGARLISSLVTKERTATFRAVPGTARLRAPARTAIPGLWLAGAWTDTGWPATMEGACRSGRAAGRGALLDADRAHRLHEEVA